MKTLFSLDSVGMHMLSVCLIMALLVPIYGKAPIFLTKKPAITEEYTLLSTYINPSAQAYAAPTRIESQDGQLDITLTVEESRVHVDNLFEYTARTFCWQGVCKAPGPSLFVRQGDQCTIRLINKLPAGPANEVNMYVRGLRLESTTVLTSAKLSSTGTSFLDSSSGNSTSQAYNSNPRPPNVLTGIPGTDLDDILSRGNGDDDPTDLAQYHSIVYRFTIPLDHAPGMHYYHSNTFNAKTTHVSSGDSGQYLKAYRKNSALHMMEGLVGAIHVGPRHVAEVPEDIRQMKAYELVLAHVMLGQNSKDTSEMALNIGVTPESTDQFTGSWSLSRHHRECESKLDMSAVFYSMSLGAPRQFGGRPISAVIKDVWLTNGMYQPNLTLSPHAWSIFDILTASGGRHIELEIRDEVGYRAGRRVRRTGLVNEGSANSCEVWLLAMDGVYLSEPRSGDNVDHLVLLPGSRAKIAVMCAQSGTYYMQSASSTDSATSRYSSIGSRETKSAQLLLTLVISGPPLRSFLNGSDISISSVPRPNYLISRVPLPPNSISKTWDVGLEQRGAESFGATVSDLSSGTGAFPPTHIANKQNRFWIGTGSDCSLPCYSEADCEAFFGKGYSVYNLHNVKHGVCMYATASTDLMTPFGSVEKNAGNEMSVGVGDISDIDFYARYPLALPISISDGGHFQIVSYEPARVGPASVRSPLLAESAAQKAQGFDSVVDFYGHVGDFRDTWPMLPGRTTVRFLSGVLPPRAPRDGNTRDVDGDDLSDTVSSWFHCNYLKYEDGGLIRGFQVVDRDCTSNHATIPLPIAVTPSLPASSPNFPWADKKIDSYSVSATNVPGLVSSSADASIDGSAPRSEAEVQSAIGSPFPPDRAGVQDAYKCNTDGHGWYYREVIDVSAQTRTLTTNGCPNHFSACQDADCGGEGKFSTRALVRPETLVVPLYPNFARVKRDTTCTRSKLGLALNGVGIYGRADSIGTAECYSKAAASSYSLSGYLFGSDSSTLPPGEKHSPCDLNGVSDGVLFCGDDVPVAAASMDRCAGVADKNGVYKYHIAPVCLIDQLRQMAAARKADILANDPFGNLDMQPVNSTFATSPTQDLTLKEKLIATGQGASEIMPSPQIGWALDGFPIYGPIGTRGIHMMRCGTVGAHAFVCLDDCNGFKGTVDEDHFLYRYYAAGNPTVDASECSSTTANAYISATTGHSESIGTSSYLAKGNSNAANAYSGCARLQEKCCLRSVPPSTQTPYTIGCFVGCKYGEVGCSYTGERGTSSSYEPRADSPAIPNAVHKIAAGPSVFPSQNAPRPPVPVASISEVQMKQAKRSELYQRQLERENSRITQASTLRVPSTSSYNSVQLVQSLVRPKSLIQIPFGDLTLALVEAPDNPSHNETRITVGPSGGLPSSVTKISGDAQSSAYSTPLVSMEVFPAGFGDAVIGGLAADQYAESGLLYFATHSGIYALHEHTRKWNLMVAGYTRVVISGFNFGSSASDVRLVSVDGNVCDAPVWEGPTRITCVLSALGSVNKNTAVSGQTNSKNGDGTDPTQWFSPADVLLSVTGGTTKGLHDDPLLVQRAKTGRPAITGVTYEYRPFQPRSLSTTSRKLPDGPKVVSTTNFSVEDKTTTSRTFSCDSYTASGTNDAKQNYQLCEIEACDGDVISASTCAVGGSCSGDTYFSLHTEHVVDPVDSDSGGASICDGVHICPSYTYENSEIAFNNDLCGKCSGLEYQVHPKASTLGYVELISGRRVPFPVDNSVFTQQCRKYYLRQGCWGMKACSGQTQVTVTKTLWREKTVLSLEEQERLQANVKNAAGIHLDAVRRTLYYSDVSEGGSGLLRCWLHADVDDYTARVSRTSSIDMLQAPSCTQLEVTTAPNFEKIQAIAVTTGSCYVDSSSGAVKIDSIDLNNGCDVVFFVDARTSALWRVILPALSPGNVYDYRSQRRVSYVPSYDPENSNAAYIGTPIKLIGGLASPMGMSIDLNNLVRDSNGASIIATSMDSGSYSEANQDRGTMGRAFVTLLDGRIIRIDMTFLLSPAAFMPQSIDSPLLMHAYGSATIFKASSRSRFGGVTSIPIVPSPSQWSQHRCFVVDSNQQAVYAATEWSGGAPSVHNTLDLGVFDRKNVLFPVQISSRPYNTTASSVDLYVAEFLGKIWRVRVPIDAANDSPSSGSGTVQPLQVEQGSGQGGPILLFDESKFPASAAVRKITDDAVRTGTPIDQRIVFEGLQ